MLTFTQLDTGTPKDIEATTDDADAELIRMQEAFAAADCGEMVSAMNLEAADMTDGSATFVISGFEAGEVADIFEEAGIYELAAFLEERNTKLLEGS